MDDPNQIEVPPSFVALFTSPGGQRLSEPMNVVRERYELCEDLAQMLVEQAGANLFKSGGEPAEVLEKLRLALSGPEGSLSANEAGWVATRIAELAGWDLSGKG
jgi:hypothetical protein